MVKQLTKQSLLEQARKDRETYLSWPEAKRKAVDAELENIYKNFAWEDHRLY